MVDNILFFFTTLIITNIVYFLGKMIEYLMGKLWGGNDEYKYFSFCFGDLALACVAGLIGLYIGCFIY